MDAPDWISSKQTSNPKSKSPSKMARWWKFNFVGALGIAVQFAALFVLKGLLHFDYLLATAIAVEAAVVHNFVWHEQFTWADRINRGYDSAPPTRGVGSAPAYGCIAGYAGTAQRLLRFHLANGAISILGNLALMKVLVAAGHLNYLVANVIAISLCSVVNFVVSEKWVFG